MIYKINNGSVTYGSNTILEQINFSINDTQKIGIVGRNGSGKSTLLNAIIDNSILDAGTGDTDLNITKIGVNNIGYLKQIDFKDENITMLEEVLKVFDKLTSIEKRINEILNKNDQNLMEEYYKLQQLYEYNGGYTYQKEYEVMLHKFGFNDNDKNKKISEFSGGQKTKLAFIKLLLSKPDILLLDEPTNHLDIDTIEWLEDYLKKYNKSIIIVSHDRMFLDNIVDTIVEIEYGELTKYSGNYTYYEKQKKLNYQKNLKDYNYQQQEIKRLQTIYEKFRYKPTKAKMALSKLRQIEHMNIINKPNEANTKIFRVSLDEIDTNIKIPLKINDLEFGYDKVLGNLKLDVYSNTKLAIIGNNGCGKSTLLKTLAGIIKPLNGNYEFNKNVKIGYFDQQLALIDTNKTVFEEFSDYLPNLSSTEIRSILGSFLFKENDMDKSISVLSGGEKVRLQLCKILYDKPNFLILDEPTNHMDIIGKEKLEEILLNYKGNIIFVSHDRYFIKKLANQVLEFSDKLYYYNCNYEEYLNKRTNNEVVNNKIVKKGTKAINNNGLKNIEKEIIKIEEQINLLNKELLKEEVYLDYKKSNEIQNKIDDLNNKLQDLNNKWEEYI